MPPEQIPEDDEVSRLLFAPLMGAPGGDLVWDNVFQFPSADGYCESVVWRKYAPTIADVHLLGCNKQYTRPADKKLITYTGAITATVANILKLASKNGVKFKVEHYPPDGIYHVHVAYEFDGTISKNDKVELKSELRKVFGQRSDHTCPARVAA
jgi:hypothetical protein